MDYLNALVRFFCAYLLLVLAGDLDVYFKGFLREFQSTTRSSFNYISCEICALEDGESFLQPGYEYSYSFKSEAFTEAIGTTDDKNKLSLDCGVLISHWHECQYNLQLQNCHLTASGGSPGFESAWIDNQSLDELSRYSVAFKLSNGEISEIITHENDPIHLVNIKRGVLSAFIFKMSYTKSQMKEIHTDIHGVCPLSAIPSGSSGERVKTSKDMLHCSYPGRTDWQFSPWSLFWNMSFIQHAINSTTDCDYDIDQLEKIIRSVFCKERHASMIESSQQTAVAVQTNIYYTMKFKELALQKEAVVQSDLTRKSSIIFEYELTPDASTSPGNFLNLAMKMLSDLVQESTDEINLSTIPLFTNFVDWIRSSNNLLPLVNAVKSCSFVLNEECSSTQREIAMSYLSDALVQCNTIACYEEVASLSKTDDLSFQYLNFLFYSWGYSFTSKPEILKNIMDMCKESQSNLCWLSLGTMIRRSYVRKPNYETEQLQLIKDIASYLGERVENLCSQDSNTEDFLVILKVIENMKEVYFTLMQDGQQSLMECAFKHEVPDPVRSSILQVLLNSIPCQSHELCKEMFEKSMTLLKTKSDRTTVRVAAYNLVLCCTEKYDGLENELLNILETDEDLQLKSYIAHDIKNLEKDFEQSPNLKKFVKQLKILLDEREISLEKIIHNPSAKSYVSSGKLFAKLPFVPDAAKEFGLKKMVTMIYQQYDVLPRLFHMESWWKFFRSLFPMYQTEVHSEGLEKISVIFNSVFKEINGEQSDTIDKIFKALPKIIQEFIEKPSSDQKFNFDEDILSNINKLEEMFRSFMPSLKPYFVANFDIFGSTMAYLTSGDLVKFCSKLFELRELMNNLHEGVTYNATRVIRVIEAYHQVPTLMGLPLNWTTNATLAAALRSRLQVRMVGENYDIHSKGYLMPSLGLTFLNRMVLDLPTITQIGVQTNSSGYTSTQWRANLEYSNDKKIFRLKKPSKSQKILELFRTNQLIRHNDYIDIPDWDIDRYSSLWCSPEVINSVLGNQACIDESYPIVRQRMKPWTLLSGWCKWRLSLEPTNKDITSYNIEALKLPFHNSSQLLLKFSSFGDDENNELFLNFENNSKDEKKFEITIPNLPDFILSFVSNSTSKGSKYALYNNTSTLQFNKDVKFQLIYRNEEEYVVVDEALETEEKETNIFNHTKLISLYSPSHFFKIVHQDYKKGENEITEVFMYYEKLQQGLIRLKLLLPPDLWESKSKAWVKYQMDWSAPKHLDHGIQRKTVGYIKTPQSRIDLCANAIEATDREQIIVNATKFELTSGKMLGFINFTYDFISSIKKDSNLKELRIWNITIPRKSWSVGYQQVTDDEKLKYEVELKKADMTSKNTTETPYIGWWNENLRDKFDLHECGVKVIVDVDQRVISSSELIERYPSVTRNYIEGFNHKLLKADVAFYYPFISSEEYIVYDGYFISSYGPHTYRLQNDFDLKSSYHNLKLTSHSVYQTKESGTSFYIKSFVSHVPSEVKVFNTINFSRVVDANGCNDASFEHDFRSEVFDSTTRATYKCHRNSNNLHIFKLQWTTNSSSWDALNMEVIQFVDDISPDYTFESSNFTFPKSTLNVTATWEGLHRDHKKRVLYTCKIKECQDTELLIKYLHNGILSVNLNLLGNNRKEILFEKSLSKNAKNLKMLLKYVDNENLDLEAIELNGEILREDLHVWNVKINSETYLKIKSMAVNAYNGVMMDFKRMIKDPQHPLNVKLMPMLDKTVYDYWIQTKQQTKKFLAPMFTSLQEFFDIFLVFFDTPITLLCNAVEIIKGYSVGIYELLSEETVLGWAIDYFRLPYYIRMGFENIDVGIKMIFKSLQPEDENIRFEYISGTILKLSSFKEWPSFSFDLKNIFSTDELPPNMHGASPSSKIGMIFGLNHVYTFDGNLYDSAEYSADCLYLLAHDLRASKFSVISSEKSIHILFPEMTVSIGDKNEVFVNGSTMPSQLPLFANGEKVVVKRENGVVEVWSPSLRVVCRSEDFLCILELDYWHSGGTFGLLGNADGSSENEYVLPNGEVTSDVLEFIRSYEISGKSECQNVKLSHRLNLEENSFICTDKFEELCDLSPGVKESFLHACELDLQEDLDPCYTASSYSALCYFRNMPGSTDCNVVKQQSKNIGKVLEVVLLVQQHISLTNKDNKNSPYKGIKSLLTSIDDKFKSNGYSDVKFSLVGFGGEGFRKFPNIYTTECDVWNPFTPVFEDLIKRLEFNGTKCGVDSLKALDYTLNVLGRNTFHSKVIIVLTEDDKQSKNKELRDFLQQKLENNGITLYSVSSYPSIEKGKTVYGIKADGSIFPSPNKDGSTFMNFPKGDLAKLSSGTKGSVFLSSFMVSNSPASYFAEISEELFTKIQKETDKCRSCKTVKGSWWFVENECAIVSC